MKNFIKYMLALALVIAGGTLFVTKGLDGNAKLPFFIERAASGRRIAIEASGAVVSERRALGAFSKVELNGAGQVTIVLGAENAVTVSADGNALPYVESEVRDGTLRLNLKPGIRFSGKPVSYAVTTKDLSFVKTSGSGDISVETPISADKLELRSEGSGDISALVDAKRVDVVIAGSGGVRLGGRADALDLVILGSGGVKAEKLSGTKAEVKVMGSGGVELGSFDSIEANIAGSGDVVYSGNPSVSSRVLGSGKLRTR